MELLKKSYERLRDSQIYQDWKKKHPESYLTHAFTMYEKNKESEWQFGLYNPPTDKITTFVMEESVKEMPAAEVLKRNDLLNELKLDDVDIDFNTALKHAKTLQEEKYKGQDPVKVVVLLQNLKEGIVWNLTFLTVAFKTLNIKLSVKDGTVIDDSLKSILNDQQLD